MTKKLKHTVNIAVGLNIVVFDDGGSQVDEFIFPFALLFFSLPGRLYAFGWQILDFGLRLLSKIKNPKSKIQNHLTAWRKDLVLIYWAARLLVHQRRFAYA